MLVFSKEEQKLLSLAVPWLGLPALDNPTERELAIRAFEIDYPDEVVPRGEKNLRAYMKLLGAIPATLKERRAVIRSKSGLRSKQHEASSN